MLPPETDKPNLPLVPFDSKRQTRIQYYETRIYFAVFWAVLLLRPYFEGTRSTMTTDHALLKGILNLLDPLVRFARWRVLLSECSFDVVNPAVVKHQAANALSKGGIDGEETPQIDADVPV